MDGVGTLSTTCDDLEFSRREKSEFGWDEKRMGDSAKRDVAPGQVASLTHKGPIKVEWE